MKRVALRSAVLLLLAGLLAVSSTAGQAAPSSVQELRVQQVGDITYFHVRLELPLDMVQDVDPSDRGFLAAPTPSLTPRLVGQDKQLRLVCQRFDRLQRSRLSLPDLTPPAREEKVDPIPMTKETKGKGDPKKEASRTPRWPVDIQGLEFVGRTDAKGEVKARLIYPVQGRRSRLIGRLTRTPPPPTWREAEVVLDFGKAKKVEIPVEAAERKEKQSEAERRPPVRDDLEGLWAVAQVDQFLDLDNEVRDFGFYSFAATTTARKYGVRRPPETAWRAWNRFGGGARAEGPLSNRELYETTTGAAAITESLQLRRMNPVRSDKDLKRVVPIATVPGIDVAEHPWKKMMGDKKPAPESAGGLVPHDNYYIHFKNIANFLEFSELLDQWGTNVTRAYEVTSRDHRLKQRYQQQLCLRSTALGKTLGPLVINGIAVTGNDAYLREGSDVAVLFEVSAKKVFYRAVEPFLTEAREKFGPSLQEDKKDYHGVTIESFVTPLRQVSLYRASIDPFVIYANSPVGIRRIIDAHQGRGKRLSDSLDFQYMRTIFRHDDKDEDGFAFLSDAFIRNLVGPASKIKERRRLEALVSLHMLTHGALYTGWETGKGPLSTPNLFEVTGLERGEVPMPEGKPASWDADNRVARSEAYNTIHFATPLIELPINDVTKTEADEYNRFRMEYLGLWRQYFDPIGMRVALKDGKVQLDTYILPLIENTRYNDLRRITGQKTVRFDPGSIGGKTLMQYVLRLSGEVGERRAWLGQLFNVYDPTDAHGNWLTGIMAAAFDPVGEWFLFRADDSPVYEKLFQLAERMERGDRVDYDEIARQVWSLPVAVGVDVRNPLVFAGTLATLRTSVMMSLPGGLTWEPLEKSYKGVSIVRVRATPAGRELLGPITGGRPGRDAFLPAIYYTMIDGGFYMTLNEEMMRGLIDGATAKREGKGSVDVATSLYLAPGAAEHAQGLLRRYLEYQTHQQARTGMPIWHALYRTHVVAEDATPEQAQEAAYRYLGFVPVSPDGSPYKYDQRYDEVVNERHGSFRKPTLRSSTAETSPLNFLVEELRSVRADLRFREDGIHTVLTLQRGKKAK